MSADGEAGVAGGADIATDVDVDADGALLEVRDVTKTFGGLTAADGVSFDVQPGTITSLIGPNGAGKSTTFNLITGFYTADDGEITFDGERVEELPPDDRATRGMVKTFQIARELTGMTVLENMRLAAQDHPGEKAIPGLLNTGSVQRREAEAEERAEQLLRKLDLWELRDEYAGNLSGGQRKLLELGRALMADPDLLLLDEPMAGVNPELTDRLLETIEQLRQEGMTFLIVEHDVEMIMDVSDKVVGMHNGKVLAVGPPAEISEDERMLEAYLGGSV